MHNVKRVSLAATSVVVLLSGCHRSPTVIVDEALLTRYTQLRSAAPDAVPSSDIDCYLDYSTGMGEGMRATASINGNLKDFLGGRHVTYYRVGASDDPPKIDIDSRVGNLIDLNNYREPGSKLKVALDRMAAQKNKVSLFITDFERVEDVSLKQILPGAPAPHPIDASAWGQNDFKEWLLAGNRIDIFATQYTKPDYWFDRSHTKTYPNWIYTIVFTPRSIVRNDAAFKSSVAQYLLEAYRGGVGKHFAYTADAFRIEQSATPTAGNANDNVIVQDQFTNTVAKGFEYYEFNLKDLLAFNADATQEDKRIINKVRVTSEVPFLSNVQFGIKVYDVTEPLTNLFGLATQPASQVSTDVETGKSVVVSNQPPPPKVGPEHATDNVFDFVYNISTHVAGIKLKPEFTGEAGAAVYRVDLILVSSNAMDFADSDQVMALNYGGGYAIRSLGESIKLAVRDVRASMDGRVLYTFYIKISR